MDKTASSSQAAWALLTEGVSAARVEVHRLRHLMVRALSIIENSSAREHIYQVAGDVVSAAPVRVEALERALDRTSYALSVLGEDHLRERLPLADRKMVDDAVAKGMFGPMSRKQSEMVARVARRAREGFRG